MAAKKKAAINEKASADSMNRRLLWPRLEEAVANLLNPIGPNRSLRDWSGRNRRFLVFPSSALPPSLETIVDGITSVQPHAGSLYWAGGDRRSFRARWAIASGFRWGPDLPEPVSVYVVVTGPPASGKSTCIRVAANALSAVERGKPGREVRGPNGRSASGRTSLTKRRGMALHAILSQGSTPNQGAQ